MKTHEAPLQYLEEMTDAFVDRKFNGVVLIDELLHSGNNEDRFIKAFFDREKFEKKSFSFENIERRSEIRKISCESLWNKYEIIDYSILNNAQKCLINKGSFI